jgi:hypothetical protein
MSTIITPSEEQINIVVNDEKISINVESGDVIVNVTENIVEVSTVNGGYPLPTTVYSVFGRTGNIIAVDGDYDLGELGDVTLVSSTNGDVLTYDGTKWINKAVTGTGTVTSVNMTVPVGLQVSGNPITVAGTLAVNFASGYSLPTTAKQTTWDAAYNDSIVSASVSGTTTKTLTLNQQDGGTITASWTDIDTNLVTSVNGYVGTVVLTTTDIAEGTRLYYTETRVSNNVDVAANTAARHSAVTIGTANGLSLASQVLSLALASASTTGALNSTDWVKFNTAYNDSIVSASVSGTTTKTLTLTQQDAGTITASWSDLAASGTVTSVAITESGDSLNITGSPITTSGTINIGFNGTNLQYVNGAGNLTTFPILTGYVTAVSGTAPVVSSGGTTPAISMAAATASVDGYLDNADWSTFNAKQNAITLTTTGTSGASTLVGATLNIPNYGSALTGYVPYTGATANVDLGTFNLTADVITGATGSFASNGGSDTFAINHSSGAGIALNITKGGNGEGLYINKTSGSGNAATIIGTLNATTLVKSGGTSSQFLKADGTVDSTTYQSAITLTTTGTSGAATFSSNTLNIPNYGSALSGYLPLTGGTLTGALTGTSASFSSSVTASKLQVGSSLGLSSQLEVYSASYGNLAAFRSVPSDGINSYLLITSSASGITLEENGSSYKDLMFKTGATTRLTIASTGAATFNAATQDAIQTVIRMAGFNASSQIKALDFKLTAGTPVWTITTAAVGTDAGINIMPNGSTGLSLAYAGAAIFTSSVTATAFIPSGATVPTNGMYLSAANTLNFATASTNRLSISSTGNLGLGVTPSASTTPTIEVGYVGNALVGRSGIVNLTLNAYRTATWKYANSTGGVSNFELYDGGFDWYNAASGTAGTDISFALKMRLTNDGKLLLGTPTASTFLLDVNGTGRFSGTLTGVAATLSGLLTLTSGSGTKAVWATTRSFGVNRNFQIAVDEFAEGTFTITPSTTLGGSTYTTPIFSLTAAGAATFSANVQIGSGTSASGLSQLTVGNLLGYAALKLSIDATKYSWIAGAQYNVDNGFEITPSTAVGGSTFTTPVFKITQAGLATFTSIVTITNSDQSGTRLTLANTGTGGQTINLIAGNPNVDNTGFSIAYGNTNFLRFATTGAATFSGNVQTGDQILIGSSATTIGAMNFIRTNVSPVASRMTFGTDGTGYQFAIAKNVSSTITDLFTLQDNGNVEIVSGSIKTGTPSGGTAKPWKLGQDTSTLYSATRTIQVEIDGGTYYLLAVKSTDL